VQIGAPILNSISPTNILTVSDSGTYKVVITAYDLVINPNQNNPVPTASDAKVELKFHEVPNVTISN